MPRSAKLHYQQFKGCTLYDVVPAVDKVQAHTDKHCLSETHIRRALDLLQAFAAYAPTVGVIVVPTTAPKWMQYPLPCTTLELTREGGVARRASAPVEQYGVVHHVYTVKVQGATAAIPAALCGVERVAETDRWEGF